MKAALSAVMVVVGAVLSGCRLDPDITVAGSYFPSWMLALVIGVLGTVLFWQLFTRLGIDPYLGPRPLVYGALVLAITLVLWLSVFRG
jgi:hypothetical protein